MPVRIESSFLLLAVVYGLQGGSGTSLLAWMAVVFVSILVHELGHAIAFRAFGRRPSIVLHGFGGLTYGGGGPLSTGKSVFVSVAGSLTGVALLGIPAHLALQAGAPSYTWWLVLTYTSWVSLIWNLVNLLPVRPLDGGNIADTILEASFGAQGLVWSRWLSIATSALGAVWAWNQGLHFAAFLAAYLFLVNVSELGGERKAPRAKPNHDDARAVDGGELAEASGQLQAVTQELLRDPGAPVDCAVAGSVARAGIADELAAILLSLRISDGPRAAGKLSQALHECGHFRESASVSERLFGDPRIDRAAAAYGAARSLARLGSADEAMDWLGRAVDPGTSGSIASNVLEGDADLEHLRALPRFRELVALASRAEPKASS